MLCLHQNLYNTVYSYKDSAVTDYVGVSKISKWCNKGDQDFITVQ